VDRALRGRPEDLSSAVLVFVGAKMLVTDIYSMPIDISLVVSVAVLDAAVAPSRLRPKLDARPTLRRRVEAAMEPFGGRVTPLAVA